MIPIEGTYEYIYTYTAYAVSPQLFIPVCAPPAPECTLEWSGGTSNIIITNVSIRGDNDGTITAGVTGNTGSTITWYINGVEDSGTDVVHTFTGLSAGYYYILAEEGICTVQSQQLQIIDGEFRTGDFFAQYQSELVASENPIIFGLSTARNTGTPAIGKSTFAVTGTINNNDYIEITLDYPQNYTARFTARDFPNKSDYVIASILKNGAGETVGTNTTTEIATSLAEAFSSDLILSRLYDFRASGIYVYAVAREANSKLNLSTGSTVTISGNFSCTETQIGNSTWDGQITQNYSLYTDVLINKSAQYGEEPDISTFTKVAQLELPFQSNNQHYFDISNILKNFVSTSQIDFSVSGYTTLADMMCSYRVQWGEKYPLIPNESTKKARTKGESEVLFCINSAVNWTDENDLDEHLGDIATNINPNFSISPTGATAYPYSGWNVTFKNVIFSTGDTGTTNIQISLWNYDNSSQVESWRAYTAGFNSLAVGTYYGRVSGNTDGTTFMFSRTFYVSPYGYGQDTSIQAVPKNNIMFLTNQPNPKQVQRNSSEYLYVILPKDYGYPLKIKANLYFYDGTSSLQQTLYTITDNTYNWGGVFALAAGYNELGLANYETYSGGTRKIRRVDFAMYQTIAGVDLPLTETLSYRYEIDEQPRRYGVAFLSKHGVWNIFDFSGEIVSSVSLDNKPMEVPRQVGLRGNSPLGFRVNTTYDTKVIKRHECNSGWIDEEHFDWLIELLASNRIYNYTTDTQPFITVESVNYKKSSNDDLYNIDVVFVETLQENNITI